ncbi:MAG: DUF362 domain-containing protein [Oscillospiraceae bacterium]|nr:DUF362 domain-containing protein [Oscillospiraceae bacterium]
MNSSVSRPTPDVALAPCASYDSAVCKSALERVIAETGGLDWILPGMRIGVKANLVSMMKPDAAATTHPELLRALVEMIRARGAVPVVGDSPGGLYTAAYVNRIYHATGMDTVGAELNSDYGTREITLPDAVIAKQATVTEWLLNCDAIINFCKLKSHGMMGLSAAAKNLFGTIPGTMKPEYHFRYPNPTDFANMLVDLDEFWKPQLHLVDAVVAMEGNGPTAGTPKPLGLVLAGKNPHSIDLICAGLIGLDPATVPTLCAAQARGLCPENADGVSVSDDWMPYISPDFQIITERNGLQFQNFFRGKAGTMFSGFLRRYIAARPGVEKTACVGCRKCEQVCPAKAIRMSNGTPRIDRSACIRCFCCQEFCPKGAMRVQRSALARLLVRG